MIEPNTWVNMIQPPPLRHPVATSTPPGACTVDAAGGLGTVAAAEGGLVLRRNKAAECGSGHARWRRSEVERERGIGMYI